MSEWNRNPQPGRHMQSLPVRQRRREFRPRQFFVAAGIAVAIGLIVAAAVWSDRPQARSIAGALPSASPTSTITPIAAKPGTPTPPPRKKVSPPVASVIAGDGSWLVGKQIKRGTWRTLGDETSACFWAIRSNLSYDYDATIASSNSRSAQTVALGPNARVFVTYGCRWELVR